MDRLAVVGRSDAGDDQTVVVEHAVFTSLPGPIGQGYRIVASSAGVRPEEKTEITRRSPSHGGLCEENAHAFGLSAYPLPTGRVAVACSRHAGREHTARGGERVYTHVVVLDAADFRRFDNNPLRVHRSLVDACGSNVLRPTAVPLKHVPLSLQSSRAGESVTLPPSLDSSCDADRIAYIVSNMLCGGTLIAIGAKAPASLLEWALLCLPLSMRALPAVSAGVRFSPSRQMRLVVVDRRESDLERATAGHDVSLFDVGSAPPRLASPYEAWTALIRTWWSRGRFSDIVRVTSGITQRVTAEDLARVATVCRDLDQAAMADRDDKARLRQKYLVFRTTEGIDKALVDRLLRRVEPDPGRAPEPRPSPVPSA